MAFNELTHIEWLTRRQRPHSAVETGIGDDMAVLSLSDRRVLVSSDMLLDGVHFDVNRHSMKHIGRKAIACNLSDCAAMAVRPIAVTVSIALPISDTEEGVQELFEGIFGMATEFDVAVAGGDTTRWSHPMAIDISIIAEPFPNVDPILRSGAREGDQIFVTGKLGGSLLEKHLSFRPRVLEARILAEQLGHRLHAMIDISDGLSLDLWRVCQASGTGAILEEALLESAVSEDAVRASARDGRSPLDHALEDGEDFELLLAVEGQAPDIDVPLHRIGSIAAEGLRMLRRAGQIEPLTPKGYVH